MSISVCCGPVPTYLHHKSWSLNVNFSLLRPRLHISSPYVLEPQCQFQFVATLSPHIFTISPGASMSISVYAAQSPHFVTIRPGASMSISVCCGPVPTHLHHKSCSLNVNFSLLRPSLHILSPYVLEPHCQFQFVAAQSPHFFTISPGTSMAAIHETGGNLHYTMFYFGNEDPLPTRNNLDYARPITWFSRYNDY